MSKGLPKTLPRSERADRQVRAIERNRVLVTLQAEGWDGDAARIEDLAVSAGLWWKCECGVVNDCDDAKCGGCANEPLKPREVAEERGSHEAR
jgi:hypothetical protein